MNTDLIEIKKSIERDLDDLKQHLESMKKIDISEHSFQMYEMGQKFAMFYMQMGLQRIELLIAINEAKNEKV